MVSDHPRHRMAFRLTDCEEEERGDEELLPAEDSGYRCDDRLEDGRGEKVRCPRPERFSRSTIKLLCYYLWSISEIPCGTEQEDD